MPKNELEKKLLPDGITAVFGANSLNAPNVTSRTSKSPIKITVHDKWDQTDLEYDGDIAILTFGEEIPLSTFVQPTGICDIENLDDLSKHNIGSWLGTINGTEKNPMKIELPITRNCFAERSELIESSQVFCVGFNESNEICPSDGAGFFKQIGSRFCFRGIILFGIKDQGTCDVTKSTVVFDILQHERWIYVVKMKEESSESKKLHCTVTHFGYSNGNGEIARKLKFCIIDYQGVDPEGFTSAKTAYKEIEGLNLNHERSVKFIPENIAELFPELIVYDARCCSIHTLMEKDFKGLTKLEAIFLMDNEIELIDRDSFKDLTNLRKLDLAINKLKFIEPKLFQSLSKCNHLTLMYNEIEALDENIFDKMVNVLDIYLTNNKLSVIPENLFKNNLKLVRIELKANQIQVISSSMFDHLNDVQYIDLQENICVDVYYKDMNFTGMKDLLRANCSSVSNV